MNEVQLKATRTSILESAKSVYAKTENKIMDLLKTALALLLNCGLHTQKKI